MLDQGQPDRPAGPRLSSASRTPVVYRFLALTTLLLTVSCTSDAPDSTNNPPVGSATDSAADNSITALPTSNSSAPTASQAQTTSVATTVQAPATTQPTTTINTPPVDAGALIAALASEGIPMGDTIVYTAEADPNELLGRPGNYIAKGGWDDLRATDCTSADIGWECGGDVELFDGPDALASRFDYLSTFATESLFGGYYMWRTPTAIVRVGYALTPDEAATYDTALGTLFGDVDQYAP